MKTQPHDSPASTPLDLLQRMPIFGGLREASLKLLLAHSHDVMLVGGEYFFREGDRAESLFVLEAGRAAVLKNWQEREFVLHELNAGDCFGEMALMDMGPRSASVRAEIECRAIELGTGDLLNLFEHDVEQFALIQMNLGREVCRRLRATDQQLFRISMGDTTALPQGSHRST